MLREPVRLALQEIFPKRDCSVSMAFLKLGGYVVDPEVDVDRTGVGTCAAAAAVEKGTTL